MQRVSKRGCIAVKGFQIDSGIGPPGLGRDALRRCLRRQQIFGERGRELLLGRTGFMAWRPYEPGKGGADVKLVTFAGPE